MREQLFDIVSLSVGARIDRERESFRLIQRENRSSDVEIVNLQGGRGDQGGCCNDGARATIAGKNEFRGRMPVGQARRDDCRSEGVNQRKRS